MDPAYFVIGGGLLSIYAGFYVRENPAGRWTRFVGPRSEPWRDTGGRGKLRRGASLVGGLLIAVGLALILVAAVALLGGLLGE